MALIGNGAQSEFQATAFRDLVGGHTLRVYDVDPDTKAKLTANLISPRLQVIVCNSAAEAARGADIVTTVTSDKTNATILTPDMIAPRMHVSAAGGDCPGKTELHADILARRLPIRRICSAYSALNPLTTGSLRSSDAR